eukprot:11156077-Lingulodinium_polyedra.AAC.1
MDIRPSCSFDPQLVVGRCRHSFMFRGCLRASGVAADSFADGRSLSGLDRAHIARRIVARGCRRGDSGRQHERARQPLARGGG